MNSLRKTDTRQRRDCDLNPGPSAPESSTLATLLPSQPGVQIRGLFATDGLLVTTASCAKTAEPIEVPFLLWTRLAPRNHVLGGGPDPPKEGPFFGGISRPIIKYREYPASY